MFSPGESAMLISLRLAGGCPGSGVLRSGRLIVMGTETRKILLVEDDRDANTFYQVVLRNEGFEVVGVHSGRPALEQLAGEAFDLVLLDIMLPDIDGIETCRSIREDLGLSDLPICMITASMDVEKVVAAFKVGANGYIVKPFDIDELLAKIQELSIPAGRSRRSEREWIDWIQARFAEHGAFDPTDAWQDAHRLRGDAWFNLDAQVAGVHVPWPIERPQDCGWRAIAAAVSDLAAVGAKPDELFLGLAWPQDSEGSLVESWIEGMARAAAAFGLRLRGGDLTIGTWSAQVAVIGRAGSPRANQGILQEGDLLWLTGTQGDAQAGRLWPDASVALQERFWRPQPRLEWGRKLWRRKWVTAVTDISDGWAANLDRLRRAPGLGLFLDPGRVPRHPEVAAREVSPSSEAEVFWGGDDCELAFATRGISEARARQSLARAGIDAACVGQVVGESGIRLAGGGKLAPGQRFGYDPYLP